MRKNNEMRTIVKRVATLATVAIACVTSAAFAGNSGDFVRLQNDLSVYYEEAGEGKPVIFVPGWTLTTEFFEKQVAGLSDSARVITYDPRSHGRTSSTPNGNNYAQHGTDLRQFIEALDLDNVVLVGWSFGCLDTYAYVRQYGTERLSGFICVDLSPKPTKTDAASWGSFDGLDSMAWWYSGLTSDEVRLKGFKGFTEWMLKRDATEEEIVWVREQAMNTPTSAAILTLTDTFFADYTKEAKILDASLPYMNIVRKEVEEPARKWMAANTPNSVVVVYGNHMPFWTDADAFNNVMRDFLK